MGAVIIRFVASLLTQLPIFVVFGVGLRMAWQQRASQPTIARLTSLALGILLVNAVGMTGLYMWLPPYGLAHDWDGNDIQTAFTILSVVRHLIEAVAFAFLLRAIFRGSAPGDGSAHVDSPRRTRSRGCLGLFLGGGLGAVSGVILAFVLGDPIGIAFNIRTFEGERGFFIVLILAPLFAIVGAIAGVIVVVARRRRPGQEP